MKKRIANTVWTMIAVVISSINPATAVFAASPGALDPSFGTAGFVKTNILGTDSLRDLTVQEDGKIVAIGTSGVSDFTIIRYLVNGQLDTTFSGDGIAFVDFGGVIDSAGDVEVQKDGKILVSGVLTSNSLSGIARLNANGSLDTSFDTDGRVTIPSFISTGLELQPDGKMVLGGFTPTSDTAVVRVNTNGSLDTTFDTDGIVTTNVELGDGAQEIKIQSDGKIVVAGNAGNSVTKSFVARYNTNGSLDTTFSGDGIALNDFSAAGEPTRGMTIDPISGTITTIGDNFSPNTMLAARYTSAGNLDASFSGDGILEIASPIRGGTEILQQSDRKYICAGHSGGSILDDVFLTRLNLDGTVDTTFGNNGFVNLNDDGGGFAERNLALVGDKLIIGNNANSFVDFGIERINLSPTPTESGDFDGDGFSDSAVFRPATANWFVLRSTDLTVQTFGFGANGDIPLDGDFDGDGRNDLAIYRPSAGEWWLQRSSDGTVFAAQFGSGADKAVPGDYDKDGKTDLGIFRPSTGDWLILRSSSNFTTFFGFPFGANGDLPITRQGL